MKYLENGCKLLAVEKNFRTGRNKDGSLTLCVSFLMCQGEHNHCLIQQTTQFEQIIQVKTFSVRNVLVVRTKQNVEHPVGEKIELFFF